MHPGVAGCMYEVKHLFECCIECATHIGLVCIQVLHPVFIHPVPIGAFAEPKIGFFRVSEHHKECVVVLHVDGNIGVIDDAVLIIVEVFSHDSGGMGQLVDRNVGCAYYGDAKHVYLLSERLSQVFIGLNNVEVLVLV